MSGLPELVSEFSFTLPRGLVDAAGQVHREGTMRLATGQDELVVLRDRQAQAYPGYDTLVMLSRVITRLGALERVTAEQLEGLFTQDLGYLREFFNRINQQGTAMVPVHCPQCDHDFTLELALAGESMATPPNN
jgi:hypothetical protein